MLDKNWAKIIQVIVSPTVIIASISATAYVCAYLYEVGYCQYFHIPTDYITVTWTSFLVCTPVVVVAISYWLGFIYFAYKLFVRFRNKEKRDIWAKLGLFIEVFVSISLGGSLSFYSTNNHEVSVWLMIALIYWMGAIAVGNSYGGYKEVTLHKSKKHISGDAIGLPFVVVTISFLVLACTYWQLGENNAIQKSKFFVPSSNQSLVVLKTYGDNLICTPYSTERKSNGNQSHITGNLQIFKFSSDIILTPVDTGKLSVPTNQ